MQYHNNIKLYQKIIDEIYTDRLKLIKYFFYTSNVSPTQINDFKK